MTGISGDNWAILYLIHVKVIFISHFKQILIKEHSRGVLRIFELFWPHTKLPLN